MADVVREQVEHGLDVIDDGEMSKPSFITYVTERLSGFAPSTEPGTLPWAGSKEVTAFPEFYAPMLRESPNAAAPRFACTGPITYVGQAQVQTDIANLKAALAGVTAAEAFIPAISPSNVEGRQQNDYYKTNEEYLFAIAEAMHEEYTAIVDAGFLLQIDDPRLVTYYIAQPHLDGRRVPRSGPRSAWRRSTTRCAASRATACASTPATASTWGRASTTWQLKDIVDVILKVNAGAYSFEAANPRHEHEWRVWEGVTLPEGALLIPGVITQSTVLVEHPELVAERIERFASVVGRENVIAGADCGFATFAGSTEIHPSVAWAKLQALVDGAQIASRRLWGRAEARPPRRDS